MQGQEPRKWSRSAGPFWIPPGYLEDECFMVYTRAEMLVRIIAVFAFIVVSLGCKGKDCDNGSKEG